MKYSALALDLDGTLLNEVGEIEDHVACALKYAVKSGVKVHLVSGRMHPAIIPFWQKLELDTPIISYNGCKIQTPGAAAIYEKNLPVDLTADVFNFCARNDLSMNSYFEDKLYILKDNQYARWYSEYFRVPYQMLEDKWPGDSPVKVLMIVRDQQECDAIHEIVKKEFGDRASITTSSERFIEILPQGVNKASGLLHLAELISVPLENWVAAGDGMNDLEMLLECGMGLAVENGSSALLARVKNTVSPLHKGGIERILREYFGIAGVGCR